MSRKFRPVRRLAQRRAQRWAQRWAQRPAQQPARRAVSRLVPAVLRDEPRFRLLFASQVLSVLGDRVALVALPFAVLGIGGGTREVALVSAAQFAPFVALALLAGVWADRGDRRTILMASDSIRMVCQASAAALLVAGDATVGRLACIAVVYGVADAFFAPAFTALLPTTVSPGNLHAANALRGFGFSLGTVVGPALAGLVLAFAGGAAGALAFDAATFAVSIGLLLRLAPAPSVSREPQAREPAVVPASFEKMVGHLLAGLREGWHEVRGRDWVRGFLLAIVGFHLTVLPAVHVLGPVLAHRELGGADSWAVLMACSGVGAVAGNLTMLRWRPAYPLRAAMTLVVVASLQPAVLGSGLALSVIGGLSVVTTGCLAGAGTLWETSLGTHIPERAMARVASYDFLGAKGAIPVGNLFAGALAGAVGLHAAMLCLSGLAVVSAAALGTLPGIRRLPASPRASEREPLHYDDHEPRLVLAG